MKRTSFFWGALTAAATLSSVDAAALTIKGLEYRVVAKTTKVCPGGIKPLLTAGITHCRLYKAKIGWAAPLKRVNGSALKAGEIAGYEVYWTRVKDSKSGVIKVKGATSLTTALAVYNPDTYYIAVSAIDTKGLKSPLSPVVAAKIM